jgi:hypothetical protein
MMKTATDKSILPLTTHNKISVRRVVMIEISFTKITTQEPVKMKKIVKINN